jgi:uncharacterized protein YecE (DUF72 family)
MPAEPGRLAEALAAFPLDVHVAVEPRHATWFDDEVRELLRQRRAALCWADRRGPLQPAERAWATAPWGYVRFHAGRARPRGCYGDIALARWLDRIRAAWPSDRADVFLYWNNDGHGCAPRDAARFAELARVAGVPASRAPDPGDLPVG